ncbi:MAG: alanine racemase [Pseudomonadota bacterium]|nr:alanine racemase [Pseudomonadota bacterium]
MSRGTRAVIDLDALRHNLRVARQAAPHSRVLAVVKADGYGHGLRAVAGALAGLADGLGVATFDEGMALRDSGVAGTVLLMEGVMNTAQLQQAAGAGLDLVVHQPWQVSMLLAARLSRPVRVWLKVNTGMHRLGMEPAGAALFWQQLRASANVTDLVLMSHMACADEPDHAMNRQQQEGFAALVQQLAPAGASLANSATTLNLPGGHYQWVRPGLMLYGASPFANTPATELDLRPVMQLEARVISRMVVPAGGALGYGATWQAPRDTPVAVVAIGYGDGYPRHLSPAAQVLIKGVRCPVVGRVSMDMITVDVSAQSDAGPHTSVTLWGPGLPVEAVAAWANTVNYELLCQITGRVEREYRGGAE